MTPPATATSAPDAPFSPPKAEALGTWRLDVMAFATAAVTLFVQVLVHRFVSVKLLNNYAFMVISLTMLGFAVSGALLSRLLQASPSGISGRPSSTARGTPSRASRCPSPPIPACSTIPR